MPYLTNPHRCGIPKAHEVQRDKVNHGAVWRCSDCSADWTLELVPSIGDAQVGTWVRNDNGLRRPVGYVP